MSATSACRSIHQLKASSSVRELLWGAAGLCLMTASSASRSPWRLKASSLDGQSSWGAMERQRCVS